MSPTPETRRESERKICDARVSSLSVNLMSVRWQSTASTLTWISRKKSA